MPVFTLTYDLYDAADRLNALLAFLSAFDA